MNASKFVTLSTVVLGIAVLTSTGGSALGAPINAVAIYDPADSNQVDTHVSDAATILTGAGTSLSMTDFASDVATAHANDLGGVIDFESITGNFTQIEASYGTSLSQTVNITRILATGQTGSVANFTPGTGDGVGTPFPTSGVKFFGSSTATGGTGNQNDDWKIQFSTPISAWGATVLSRGSARAVTMTITLDDNSIVTFASEAIAATDDDTFIGYRAPEGRTIKFVMADNTAGLTRWDDMAFIVPEPSTMILMCIAMSGLVAFSRKRGT